MSQQLLETYKPSNTSDDAANISRKQNEQRIANHKRKMNLRKRKQPKFCMLRDIYKATEISSVAIPNKKITLASSCVQPIIMKDTRRRKERRSENYKSGKPNLHRRKLQRFRMLADVYKDTKVLPAAIPNNNTIRASECVQERIGEGNPPSSKEFSAALQLLKISNGEEPASAAKGKTLCRLDRVFNISTSKTEIGTHLCRVNKNPAEFCISTSKLFMRSI